MVDMVSTFLLRVDSFIFELSECFINLGCGENLMVVHDRAVFNVLVVNRTVA
jgi:hypothetical protein